MFKIRGQRQPPAEVVLVAMDEASEAELGKGQDLRTWRPLHAQLIRVLQHQGVALIVFDLQLISAHPDDDPALAAAMQMAGNVLITECVQVLRRATEDFYGREECSEAHKKAFVQKQAQQQPPLPEQFVAMRRIPPTPILAAASLDHAPFYLANDAGDTSIQETWIFIDALAEMPSLPLLAWFYTLKHSGALADILPPTQLLSAWLSQQRRACFTAPKTAGLRPQNNTAIQQQIDAFICGDDSRFLNFYGPPQTFRMESYSDVYQAKVSDLQGKVVFVGKTNRQYSPGKTDYFQTPFSDSHHGKMAGLEIMASQYANFLDNSFITIPFTTSLVLLVYGLVLSLILTIFTGFTGLLISILLSISYAAVVYWLFSWRQLWLPIAVPLLVQLPLALLISLSWSRWDLLAERKRILAFVRQVFPQWINYVPSSPGQWYPENNSADFSTQRDVRSLCLATDIEGYTSVAARYTAHQMWALLSEYYQILGGSVYAHKGLIADITGDAMMALWLDLPKEYGRTAACLAALEMNRAIDRFNEASKAGRLPTRIGLHEGDITLGRLDAGKVSHYRAIGDTVNTASRIQGVNKYLGTKILASDEIVSELVDIVCRPVGHFRLIGRHEAVALFEVVGLSAEIESLQYRLHQQFAEALAYVQQGQWDLAASHLQALLDSYPEDGPSKFYLDLCTAFQTMPPPAWDGVVTLDGK